MNRQEFLDWLIIHVKTYPTGEAGEGFLLPSSGGWNFHGGYYSHPIELPVNVHDWNQAKIKPNTKIEVHSPEHSRYVQDLAFSCGFNWEFNKGIYSSEQSSFLFFCEDFLILKEDDDEFFFDSDPAHQIFIELPSNEGEEHPEGTRISYNPFDGYHDLFEYLQGYNFNCIEGRIIELISQYNSDKDQENLIKARDLLNRLIDSETDHEWR